MAQPGLRTASSRSRLGRNNGMTSSRSGERLHVGNNENLGQGSSAGSTLLRNKASRTAMSTTASSSLGKASGNAAMEQQQQQRRRPALGDKTNVQNNQSSANPTMGTEKVGGGDHTLKHKMPSTATVTVKANDVRPITNKPRAQSVISETSTTETQSSATLTTSRSYAGNRHLRGVSSSSGTNLSRDVNMSDDASTSQRSSVVSTVGSSVLTTSRNKNNRSMDIEEAESASLSTKQQQQQSQAALARRHLDIRSQNVSTLSADEDMSEVESDWRSSSMETGMHHNNSSKTDTEDDLLLQKESGSALVSSDDEDEEAIVEVEDGAEDEELEDEYDEDDDEEEGESESESVQLNNLDPDCLISLPFEIDELARSKVERICARYEETVLHDVAVRQSQERHAAVGRGEMTADTAAHEDELALMGLDPDEVRDTSMVAEYAADIFAYMAKCECRTMANPNYMDFQGEIRWHMRATLVDWLMQVHMRYHMMPETLWIAMNVVDRFLSARVVSLAKLQLVGVTAMFIAAKYEEILAPSVDEFVFMTENGYTRDEILKGERIILTTLDFNISGYCSPYSWCRRISKADDYDIQTRTLAKFFMELTLFDHRFLRAKPSLIASIAMYLSRKMLGGTWNDAFVYYSRSVEEQLIPGANLLLERLLDENFTDCFVCQKYGNRRYLKASIFARDWAIRNQETMLVASASNASNLSAMSGGAHLMATTEEGQSIPSSVSTSIVINNTDNQYQRFAEQIQSSASSAEVSAQPPTATVY